MLDLLCDQTVWERNARAGFNMQAGLSVHENDTTDGINNALTHIIWSPGRRDLWDRLRTAAKGLVDVHILGTWLDKHLPMVLPTTTFRFYWDMMVMGMVLYNAVLVPFDAGKHTRCSLVDP